MNSLLQRRSAWIIIIMLLLTPSLVSCAPNANAMILSPNLGEQVAVATIEAEPGYGRPTEVPKPTTLAVLTDEEIFAGLPDEIVAAIKVADTSNAENIAAKYACSSCHKVDPDHEQPAPTWWGIGNTAVTRGESPEPANYLYRSIIYPNEFLVKGYDGGAAMPENFEEQMSTEELADIIAYLLEQQQVTTE